MNSFHKMASEPQEYEMENFGPRPEEEGDGDEESSLNDSSWKSALELYADLVGPDWDDQVEGSEWGKEMQQLDSFDERLDGTSTGFETQKELSRKRNTDRLVKSAALWRIYEEKFDPILSGKMGELFGRITVKLKGVYFDLNIAYRRDSVGDYVEVPGKTVNDMKRLAADAQEEFERSQFGKFKLELERMGFENPGTRFLVDQYLKARKDDRIEYRTGQVYIRLPDNPELRFMRFRSWARRDLSPLSGVAIAVAAAITTIVVIISESLKKGAKVVSSKKNKPRPKPKPIPPLPGPTHEPEPEPENRLSELLEWMSENILLTSVGIAIVVVSMEGKQKKK